MDEVALMQSAVRRRRLTKEQLREAEEYARGGRSLLSVVLDLGYLTHADILDLE